jgi:hypothetical protein
MCWILPAKRCSDFKWNPNENVRCPFGYWKTADSFVGNRYLGEKIFVCHVKSLPQPPGGSQCLDVSDNLLWHAQEKAPYKEAAGASTSKAIAKTIKKRRRRRRKVVAEPVPVVAEVKSVMHRILEGQREQLNQLSDDLQQVIFFGW